MKTKKNVIKIPKPEMLYPYSPVASPMPPPPVQSACEGDIACITLSCAVIPYVLGALEIYRWEDSFTGTAEEKRIAVGVFHEVMREIAMACGCDDNNGVTVIRRVNPVTGYPEISKDDGVTWESGPESAYSQATEAAPLRILDTNTARCEMANNVVENLKDLQATYSAKIGAIDVVFDMVVEILVAAIGILLIGLLPEVVIPLVIALIPKMIETARLLTNTTQAFYDGLFTNAVWDSVLCTIYCHAPDDGNFTEGQWLAIISEIKSQLGSGAQTAGANIAAMIDVWGVIGLKNASRLGSGAEGNCDDCDCSDEWWYEFDFTNSAYNTIWQPTSGTTGHYTAGVGYEASTPIDISYLVIRADLVPYGGLELIGYIVEQAGATVTNYNRGVFFNETRDNYDTNTDVILDAHERWIGETGGALNITYLAPQWIGPAAGGGSDVKLTRVVLHGKGVNPFGADNYVYNPLSP